MPKIGDESTTTKLGLPTKMRSRVYWSACPECGREKWVQPKRFGGLCNPCSVRLKAQPVGARAKKPGAALKNSGARNKRWNGGKKKHVGGYLYVRVEPDDPMWEMTGKNRNNLSGYILEHRLIVARSIGRVLLKEETVHHRNGKRDDNRIENLELWFGYHGSGQRDHEYHCPGCTCVNGENQ